MFNDLPFAWTDSITYYATNSSILTSCYFGCNVCWDIISFLYNCHVWGGTSFVFPIKEAEIFANIELTSKSYTETHQIPELPDSLLAKTSNPYTQTLPKFSKTVLDLFPRTRTVQIVK